MDYTYDENQIKIDKQQRDHDYGLDWRSKTF